MSPLDLRPAFELFIVEGRELATEMEQGLLQLEQGHDRGDAELINAMFRAAHTIKGSAGILGIHSLGRFTHHVETLMDRVRSGEPLLDDAMISRLLACCDHINTLIDLAEADDLEGRSVEAAGQSLLDQLAVPASDRVARTEATVAAQPAASAAGQGFRLFAVFGPDSLRDGLDPAASLLFMAERTAVDRCVPLSARVPVLAELDAEQCHIALALQSQQGDAAVALDALDFFGSTSLLVMCPGGSSAAQVHALLEPLRDQLGDEALQPWREAGLIGDAEWTLPATPASVASAATAAIAPPPAQARDHAMSTAPARFVRVPAERLDELILQVGELVIAGASVDVLARDLRHTRLAEAVNQLTQLIDTIQSGTLQLRMVPIGDTFNRFQRVVRDVAQDLGKSIALELVGGDTELDKAMVERIGDPLMHLVRNAMDHGLETPAERLAAGKPEQGTLRLRAFHDSGSVVVEVSDDGRGLNRERILAKAIERGLVSSGEGLSDNEVHELIFEAGFSTAEQVTSLSGRGVGMDVVKRSVEALRGTITLHSKPGQGSLVQLRLPLTLAIIDGFLVGVGTSRFIVPLDLVVECIELPADALSAQAPQYLTLRNELLPYINLRQALGVPGLASKRPSVVVVRSAGIKTGILVDTLHGEIQTVIKPMSRIFRQLRDISGTSILGSGEIALILDVHQLVQRLVDRASRQAAGAPSLS